MKARLSKGHPAVEVAVVLHGGAREEPFACEAVSPKTATGRALAWRLVVLRNADTRIDELEWNSVIDWKPPEDCSKLSATFPADVKDGEVAQ